MTGALIILAVGLFILGGLFMLGKDQKEWDAKGGREDIDKC